MTTQVVERQSGHDSAYVPAESGPKRTALPSIIATNRELRDITADALDALVASNVPPTLFQRGSTLLRLRDTADGVPLPERLGEDSLRGLLTRAADWRRATPNGLKAISPPLDVVNDILALPTWPAIPHLDAIIEAPTFSRDGTILSARGYHAEARLYLYPPPDLVIPVIPERPSREQVRDARDLLLGELLADFPFEDEPSRAHVLAALLLPFVRPMIDGPTPLHVIDAPTPGTGKGLLADVITIPATGRSAEVMAEGQNDEEWRKRITATLERAPSVVLIDNVRRRLDSAALAAALTGMIWTDRILGTSSMISLPVRGVWLATGNNVGLSTELARRTVYIRLDPRMDAPWERTGFRHADLRGWARHARGRLIHACLTLAQAWIATGRPPAGAPLGSFESWSAVIGGILKVAEVPGFLGNRRSLFTQVEDETVSGARSYLSGGRHATTQRLASRCCTRSRLNTSSFPASSATGLNTPSAHGSDERSRECANASLPDIAS